MPDSVVADVLSPPPPPPPPVEGTSPPPPAPPADDGGWWTKTDGLDDDAKSFFASGKYASPVEALKALPNAQRLLSGDKIPAPKDGEDITKWAGWEKLGALPDVDAYAKAIKRPEMPEGVAYDEEGEKAFLEHAVKNRIPLHAVQATLDLAAQMRLQAIQMQQQALQQERAEYGREAAEAWGRGKPQQEELARRAARWMGLDVDAAQELGDKVGSFKMMQALAKLGKEIAEDGNLIGGRGQNDLGISAEQARAEIKAQNEDPEIGRALRDPQHPQHKQHTDRRKALQSIAYAGLE